MLGKKECDRVGGREPEPSAAPGTGRADAGRLKEVTAITTQDSVTVICIHTMDYNT